MLVSQICKDKGVIADPSWQTMEHFAPLDKTSLKKIHGVQPKEQPEIPPTPQQEPFPVAQEFFPPEQPQPQDDQPYIPVDDRTDRQILLGLETSIT